MSRGRERTRDLVHLGQGMKEDGVTMQVRKISGQFFNELLNVEIEQAYEHMASGTLNHE